ncbi:FtsK/SpoIIIE domain-containing protein [Spongisporangium articulatum]|uniref:FtsK/SpoIIIE domain-containing protein n=1 Tax=Spongisporangium articulatum TaxID=3362603 RepID=A0ABW8AQP6_9ACTN
MSALAAELAPGWLGSPWAQLAQDRPQPHAGARPGAPTYLRVGTARPVPGVEFPALVPLFGVGHLSVGADAREPAVAALVQGLITRALCVLPAGALRVLAVDGASLGRPFAPFSPLVPAGLMSEPVTDSDGFHNVLNEAEEQVRRFQARTELEPDVLLVAIAGLPPGTGRGDVARLAALAHAGPAARVHLLVAGYPPPSASARDDVPRLELTTHLTLDERPGADGVPQFRVGDPPREVFGASGRGLNSPVAAEAPPPPDLVGELCRRLAAQVESDAALTFDDVVPAELWTESSVSGLSTVVGRLGRGDAVLSLDDATPHWLVGGRTGSGKTVFLLDVLYGLAARYSPDELALYLLDFKEGVSFTEFVPTEVDPTWVPHARTVGVESDREYGLAVLAELVREMNRRAAAMKQAGVTNLAQLREARREAAPIPRILTVIDEFHVLFQGNDKVGERAAALLEEIARKGRSYGVHLILASQSIQGIDALIGRSSSVFGQFGRRIALGGGGGVLESVNSAADDLPIGTAIVNDAGGVKNANRRVRFPDADVHTLSLLRHRLWSMRTPGEKPPAVFVGYAEQRLEQDPTYLRLESSPRRRRALLGRAVEVGLPTAGFEVGVNPGSHLAVLGTSPVGADVLRAVALSLAAQHEPGSAVFLLAALVSSADSVVDDVEAQLEAGGHFHEVLDIKGYRDAVQRLAAGDEPSDPVYLFAFGADAASSLLAQRYPDSRREGVDDLRAVLRDGPGRHVHVFGWWRGVRRLLEDVGSSKAEIGNVLSVNVRGDDLSSLVGSFDLKYSPRQNRAMYFDRDEDRRQLVVPFVTAGRFDDTLD